MYRHEGFFLSGFFSHHDIHIHKTTREGGGHFQFLCTTSIRFTSTCTLHWLLQGAHLSTWLVAGHEPRTFGFRAQIFKDFSTYLFCATTFRVHFHCEYFQRTYSQLTFTCSRSTIETLKKGMNMFNVNNKTPERGHKHF